MGPSAARRAGRGRAWLSETTRLGDGADVVGGAEDGAAESSELERGGVEVVEEDLLGLLLDLGESRAEEAGPGACTVSQEETGKGTPSRTGPSASTEEDGARNATSSGAFSCSHHARLLHLPEDNRTLALNRGLLNRAVLQDVGQDVHSLRHVLLENLRQTSWARSIGGFRSFLAS